MNVARPGKDATDSLALTFMSLDDDITAPALAKLKGLSFLHDVAKIRLR